MSQCRCNTEDNNPEGFVPGGKNFHALLQRTYECLSAAASPTITTLRAHIRMSQCRCNTYDTNPEGFVPGGKKTLGGTFFLFLEGCVEESKAVLESERSRHQRSKDDLALSLRVARKKAECMQYLGLTRGALCQETLGALRRAN
eukprot:1159380-Pelagomonas_calceolata.AAC.4